MHYQNLATIGIVALVLAAGGCNRDVGESRDTAAREERIPAEDRAAELQRERNEEISRLDKRVADIERDYAEANQKVVSGDRTATAGLREELKEDVTNVKMAVNDLKTTTPENWWDRHEAAMKQTASDIEADVSRLAGKVTPAPPQTTTRATGENVSTEPFTSRRDKFVADIRARVDAMEQALGKVKARGAQETELEDTRARVKKLGEDADRLRSASADDWWDVTKARVNEYVDRIEASVKRLDDNKS
jgi:archaellum component FlaC